MHLEYMTIYLQLIFYNLKVRTSQQSDFFLPYPTFVLLLSLFNFTYAMDPTMLLLFYVK